MQNREQFVFHPIQMLVAAVKLLSLFLLPVAVLQIPGIGEVYGFRFLEFYTFSNIYLLLLLLLYAIALVFTFYPFQRYSMLFSILLLAAEIIALTNTTLFLPVDSTREFLYAFFRDINQPLVNLTLIEQQAEQFLSKYISNPYWIISMLKKFIQFLTERFPQYFHVVQYTIELISKSISELYEILVQMLPMFFRSGIGTIINVVLSLVYALCGLSGWKRSYIVH